MNGMVSALCGSIGDSGCGGSAARRSRFVSCPFVSLFALGNSGSAAMDWSLRRRLWVLKFRLTLTGRGRCESWISTNSPVWSATPFARV